MGGYVYAVDDMKMLERFIIMGCEGGTYFVLEEKLARENVQALDRYVVLVYCTLNGTQFFVFRILRDGFFTLKTCMRIDIAKLYLYLDLNFGGE